MRSMVQMVTHSAGMEFITMTAAASQRKSFDLRADRPPQFSVVVHLQIHPKGAFLDDAPSEIYVVWSWLGTGDAFVGIDESRHHDPSCIVYLYLRYHTASCM